MIICPIQYFEADFLWKVSLKILNSGIILKTFTHGDRVLDLVVSSETHSRHSDVFLLGQIKNKCVSGNMPEHFS